MVNQFGFSKVLLICFSTFGWSAAVWSAASTSAFSQTPTVQVESAASNDSVDPDSVDLASIGLDSVDLAEEVAATDETAVIELMEALEADGIVVESFSFEPSHSAPSFERTPSASVLGEFEAISLEAFSIDSAAVDLADAASTFVVADSEVPALVAALESEHELSRLYAAEVLWTLTGDRDLILPTLTAATASQNSQVRELAQDAMTVVRSENRSSAVLGIIARESRKRLLPRALRMITDLF